MDGVWDWFYEATEELRAAGEGRLAEVLGRLPNAALQEVPDFEAIAQEARVGVDRIGHPWLQVFVRHWTLQGRIETGGEAEVALAVEAIELAHRPEAIDCPQTVCAAQDLGIFFGRVDGPGYAEARILAAEDGIGRIDPTRECYRCLTDEQTSGLLDLGRPAEALALVDERIAGVQVARPTAAADLAKTRAQVLLPPGRPEEAVAEVQRWLEGPAAGVASRSSHRSVAFVVAEAHLVAGRHEQAVEALPALGDLPLGSTQAVTWAEHHLALVDHDPTRNTAEVGAALWRHVEHLSEHRVHRPAVRLAIASGELARRRGAAWRVERAVRVADHHLPALRAPLEPHEVELLARLRAGDELAPAPPPPVGPDELSVFLGAAAAQVHDVELRVEWLRQAVAVRPDDAALVLDLCAAEAAAGLPAAEVDARLWHFLEGHPTSTEAVNVYGMQAVGRVDEQAIERLELLVGPDLATDLSWIRANLAWVRGDLEQVVERCRAIVEAKPDARNTRRLWSAASRGLGDLPEADRLLREVVALSREDEDFEPGNDHWIHLEVLTLLGDWAGVRQVAGELGMAVEPGPGPVDEQWEAVLVEVGHDGPGGLEGESTPAVAHGPRHRHLALRTGPVTARILSVDSPDAGHQHCGAEVVFDARPLDPIPEDEEELRGFRVSYAWVADLRPSDRTAYEIDGVHPQVEQWIALRDELDELGVVLWMVAADGYVLRDAESGEERDGAYGLVAVGPEADLAAVDALLERHTSTWEHPIHWGALASAAGRDVAPHRAIASRFSLPWVEPAPVA